MDRDRPELRLERPGEPRPHELVEHLHWDRAARRWVAHATPADERADAVEAAAAESA